MAKKTILLVGLGNPGEEYSLTRHNIGFLAIDEICRHYKITRYNNKFKAHYAKISLNNYNLICAKPCTYMNRSGIAVREIANFFKIDVAGIFVIHDDIDLKPFQIKYKIGGGNGGHKGLKSIDQHCSQNYARLRLGIGRPACKDAVSSYVLHKFTKEELDVIAKLLPLIAENIELLLSDPTNFLQLAKDL